ncbi:sensor histidine kinase [Sporolactobacillus pectinivorans]|uniref:sensor histidine kinase n=1 Tax=Sporolactobacillus pectinivorans TaxID=1591408 RepID=UPI000C264B32|nr:sensor histidine kinase [Sporolactobacillus pectinivorans]
MTEYIRDRVFLFIFYIAAMVFITIFLYLEPSVRLRIGNLIYLHAVVLFLFLLYLLFDFLRCSRFLSGLVQAANALSGYRLTAMPAPKTAGQKKICRLLDKIERDNRQKVQDLQHSIEENKDFVMAWVHQVKTPIAAGKMLINHNEGQSQEQILDRLEDEFSKIDYFVEQALYYSRTDSFSNDYFISEYAFHDLVNPVLKKYAKLFIAKKISVALSDLDLQILTDKKWLEFIIDQLISNALKYTDVRGRVRISGRKYSSGNRLIIEDNGRGISPENIRRVFEKGFTGAIGRKARHSTGIGLYLAKTLALKLGHNISISSEEGKGTTVILDFPNNIDYTGVAREHSM